MAINPPSCGIAATTSQGAHSEKALSWTAGHTDSLLVWPSRVAVPHHASLHPHASGYSQTEKFPEGSSWFPSSPWFLLPGIVPTCPSPYLCSMGFSSFAWFRFLLSSEPEAFPAYLQCHALHKGSLSIHFLKTPLGSLMAGIGPIHVGVQLPGS